MKELHQKPISMTKLFFQHSKEFKNTTTKYHPKD